MEMSQDDPPSHSAMAQLLMAPLCTLAGSTACKQHGSQSPCFLHTECHPQLHPVWSGRSLSLSTTASGKGSEKERKLQQSEAGLNSYGRDFQKPPTVLYSHLKSLVRVVFPEGSGFFTRQEPPRVQLQVRVITVQKGTIWKIKNGNCYEVNSLYYVTSNILLIGCSAPR